MLQPGRLSRGKSIRSSSRSLVHFTVSARYSAGTAYPWLFASLRAQTVMVPWWQVAHWRSFRHFAASCCRNARPRSAALRPCEGGAAVLGISERAGPPATASTQKAHSPARGEKGERIWYRPFSQGPSVASTVRQDGLLCQGKTSRRSTGGGLPLYTFSFCKDRRHTLINS